MIVADLNHHQRAVVAIDVCALNCVALLTCLGLGCGRGDDHHHCDCAEREITVVIELILRAHQER